MLMGGTPLDLAHVCASHQAVPMVGTVDARNPAPPGMYKTV